jgi:hypothetical protein
VSAHQLLRWHDRGLLPQPRREGLGRGKGTASYYPRSAVLQARTLARLLARRRNLDEAGWGLWALGFPVTAWARALLLDQLERQAREYARADRSLRRRKGVLAEAASRPRAPRNLARMRKGIRPEGMLRVLQMLVAYPLGTLRAEDYTEEEWARFHDATLRELWPAILDDPELPLPNEVAAGMAKLSRERSFEQVIAALKETPDARLEQYRNELQWLTELLSTPDERATAVMSREAFVAFLKMRHMDQEGSRGIAQWMQSLGQTRPPPSQLQRWLAALKQLSVIPSPTIPDR